MKILKPLLNVIGSLVVLVLLTVGLIVLLRSVSNTSPSAQEAATTEATAEITVSPPLTETDKATTATETSIAEPITTLTPIDTLPLMPTKTVEAEITPLPMPIVAKELEILNGGYFARLAWSPDSSKLSYTKFSNEFLEVPNGVWERGEIWIFDLNTKSQKLIMSSGQTSTWSPDGQRLSISIINPNKKLYDIVVYNLNTQEIKDIGSSSRYFNQWFSNQDLIIATEQGLKMVNISSGKAIEVELNNSANGLNKIANLNTEFAIQDLQGNLIRIDINNQRAKTALTKNVFDWLALSSSGQMLAYVTHDIPPVFGILNLQTTETQVLLQADMNQFTDPRMYSPVWSPDSRFVALSVAKTTGTNIPVDIYLFDSSSGYRYQEPLIKNVTQSSLIWAPNGRRLAFIRDSSSEFGLKTSVYVVELR
ncbi:MAG: hypothetical protein JW953_13240 [Anaerolineae bacterium]|nr:hypothetical protein [Anaerolineae bacterium]